jgi:hypothetical protein
MTNKYVTEVKDVDGKILGKVVTEEPLSAEEIAELTEASRNKKRQTELVSDQEAEEIPQPTGEDVEATVADELASRRGQRRGYIKNPEGSGSIRTSRAAMDVFDPDFDLGELDDEELLRGRKRDVNGGWMGKNPRAIPADYHRRAMKELFRRAELQLQVHLPAATKALTNIATGDDVDTAQQRMAAQWVIERVMGKTPEKVEITKSDPWADAIEGVAVDAEEEAIARARGVLDHEEADPK